MTEPRIVAVDVGSVNVKKGNEGNFGWAALRGCPGTDVVTGTEPPQVVTELVSALESEGRAVLALECPLMVPVPSSEDADWTRLGRGRQGEGDRPWSAGAGPAALATGLAQGAWIVQELARLLPGVPVTTDAGRWLQGGGGLLILEAFVSGEAKVASDATNPNVADAIIAAREIARRLERESGLDSNVKCWPDGSLNLAAAMALRAGLHIDAEELRREVVVVRC